MIHDTISIPVSLYQGLQNLLVNVLIMLDEGAEGMTAKEVSIHFNTLEDCMRDIYPQILGHLNERQLDYLNEITRSIGNKFNLGGIQEWQ